jgi:hypothetical protein
MVTRTRLRAVLTALGLYSVAALIIGYFGLSAYTGAHGLKAKQDLAQQQITLTQERDRLVAERKDVGAQGFAPARRQSRSRHARRARPRNAQLPASARADADPEEIAAAFRLPLSAAKSAIRAKPWRRSRVALRALPRAPDFRYGG